MLNPRPIPQVMLTAMLGLVIQELVHDRDQLKEHLPDDEKKKLILVSVNDALAYAYKAEELVKTSTDGYCFHEAYHLIGAGAAVMRSRNVHNHGLYHLYMQPGLFGVSHRGE